MIRFTVYGIPKTQGSKRTFKNAERAWVVEMGGEAHKSWREAVAAEARHALNGGELLTGPVVMQLTFGMPKRQTHPKKKRIWPIGKLSGDVDKLARAVMDSCTGTIFNDDCQVVDLHVTKDFADPPGVEVIITGPVIA